METTEKIKITVECTVKLPVEKVWYLWTAPIHIVNWNHASDDWHTPNASNDFRVDGKFVYRMEAKDGSFGFDFGGMYNEIRKNKLISYTIGDGRKVQVLFINKGTETKLIETFEKEDINSFDLQKTGWQSILDNFKKYAETNPEIQI
jgi:uncharacterized protein YndB with AHSA1/START domain